MILKDESESGNEGEMENDIGYEAGSESEDERERERKWWDGLSWWRKLYHAVQGIVEVCAEMYLDDVFEEV